MKRGEPYINDSPDYWGSDGKSITARVNKTWLSENREVAKDKKTYIFARRVQ